MRYIGGRELPPMKPVNVVELRPVTRRLPKLMTDREWAELSLHLALHPRAGDVIPGTGGWRKVRWAVGGDTGKSGGVRVITFFRAPHRVYVGSVYPKSHKGTLSAADRAALKKITESLG